MAHKDSSGRGTLVLDRVVTGVGRIKKASGTTDRATFKRINGMVDALKAKGRLDLLEGLRDGIVTPLQLWDAFRRDDLDRLPTPETIAPLWTVDGGGAVERWLGAWGKSPDHKRATASTFRLLRAIAGGPECVDARVGDLPALLAKYRSDCAAAGYATSFKNARSHVQAFLRDTVGRQHRLYQECARLQLLAAPKRGRKQRSAGGLPVPAFAALLGRLAALETMGPECIATAFAMAGTGMGTKELWGVWEDVGTWVDIYGTKRETRERQAPRLWPVTRPQLHPRTFANKLAEAQADVRGPRVTPYDLRRTFGHWLEEARIIRARRKLYLGHSAGDVTGLYERHELESYLVKDGAAVRDMIAERWPADAVIPCPCSPTIHNTTPAGEGGRGEGETP